MADIVQSVASKVAEYVVAPVGRQCGYVIFTNSYVGELKEEMVQLENARQRVQHSIDEARNNMKPIEANVEEWMKKVETVANKVSDVLDYDGRAKKTCFCGWIPNPKARHRLGKDANKTIQDIQALIAQRNTWDKVYYENAPPGKVHVVPEGNSPAGGGGDNIQEHIARGQSENAPPELVGGAANLNSSAADGGDIITSSRASIFHNIMEALGDDKLKVIGVYGPCGVGKTTLLKEVEEKLRKGGSPFHMIVKAQVSQNQDLTKIRYDIAYALSLNLKDEPSEEGKKDLLSKRLQRDPNEKILIILDDLWDKLDLKAVGIPSGDESRGCKLLLSSRFKDVLVQKMHADRTFLLEGLNNDEAFRLFEKTVGDKLKDEEKLKPIAAQVVKKLAGLPLLIISVASTLKCRDAPAWRNALIKIEESNVETIVKLAYDHLKSEDAKSLFLLCGLIGGTIRVENLFVLSMGLGMFEGFNKTMEDARDRLNTTLDDLRSACLLLDGGDDEGNVTIHDLYSEVVVSTPFRGQNSLIMNNNSWSKEKLEQCWAICLMDVGRDRRAELMQCGFPDLKILVLSQPQDWRWLPEHRHDVSECSGLLDFTCMKQLLALYIRSMHIPTLPSSIQILENLQSLYLDHCDVEDVAILGKLKALQILSFAGSTISKLPKEIGDLTNLRSLNLSNCWWLKIIESGALKGLINLEELLMQGSFDGWMGNDEVPSEPRNAKLAELKSLTKLTALEISIPDPTILLEDGDLPFGNLIRFWIKIGNVYGREFRGLRTMTLKLEGCDGILSKEWVQKTLHKTQYLCLDGLREFKKSAHELCIRGFSQLKHLDIYNSPSIEYIVNASNGLPLTAFTKLESLFLENLINLEKIWNGPVAPDCFSKLKAVSIQKCRRLKNLGFLSEMQRLAHLEEMDVWACDSLQDIVTYEVGKVEVAHDYIVELPNVRRMYLSHLPNMTSFCIGAEGAPIQVSFPRLESLGMGGPLDLEKILYSQPPLQYTNLKSIEIWNSASDWVLKLKSDWVLKLPNLESLLIVGCHSTKVVFNLEELKVMGHVEILSPLTNLTLSKLPDLQHVWKHDVKLQGPSAFRNLKELIVRDSGLAFLFPISVAKCLREIRNITVTDCRNMEALIVDEEGRDEGTDDIIEFPKLERLFIWNCPMKKFFSCPSGKKELITTISDSHSDSFFDQKVKLPNITRVAIKGAQCKELWSNQIPDDSFHKLKYLQLQNCDNLQRVAPSHMWKRLQLHLDILKVKSCRSIEIIYEGDDPATESGKLTRLILCDLENMRHIWKSDDHPSVPLPNLRFIAVQSCPRLKMLFPTFTPEFLGQIKELAMESCEDMELIAGHEECEEATGRAVTFSELTALRLYKLPKFMSFLPEKYPVEFPSLQVLSRVRCGTEPDQSLGDQSRYGDGGANWEMQWDPIACSVM